MSCKAFKTRPIISLKERADEKKDILQETHAYFPSLFKKLDNILFEAFKKIYNVHPGITCFHIGYTR